MIVLIFNQGWCDESYDPNSAEPCDPKECHLPKCFCSQDGKQTPNNLVQGQVRPQIKETIRQKNNIDMLNTIS